MSNYYLCVTPFFPTPSAWQGAYILDQVKAIRRNSDYEVVVFKTCPLDHKPSDYVIDGIRVNEIRPLLMPSYFLNGLTENIVGYSFVRELSRRGIDPADIKYVHCHTVNHSAFGFGVKRENRNAKVLVQFHDLDPLNLRNGFWADKKWNRRFRASKSVCSLNRADLLVCISTHVRDVIMSFPHPRKDEVYESALRMYDDLRDMKPVSPRNLYVLNNGVDTRIFNVCSSKRKETDIFRIGCIANFQELKDHKSLVEAFRMLIEKGYQNLRLSMLGSGETRSLIENYVRQHGLEQHVEWPDEVRHEQLADYYRSLDLFVLPSVYEGFGCVYTEAYACGVPFICCEGQGASELVLQEDREKWLVGCHNPLQLASRIERQYSERNVQTLNNPVDIDILIRAFLDFINLI